MDALRQSCILTVRSHTHYSNKALLYKIVTSNIEALPEVLGNRGTRACISGGQGNKCIKMRGTGTKAILGNIENKIFDLGEQGNKAIYFGGTRE